MINRQCQQRLLWIVDAAPTVRKQYNQHPYSPRCRLPVESSDDPLCQTMFYPFMAVCRRRTSRQRAIPPVTFNGEKNQSASSLADAPKLPLGCTSSWCELHEVLGDMTSEHKAQYHQPTHEYTTDRTSHRCYSFIYCKKGVSAETHEEALPASPTASKYQRTEQQMSMDSAGVHGGQLATFSIWNRFGSQFGTVKVLGLCGRYRLWSRVQPLLRGLRPSSVLQRQDRRFFWTLSGVLFQGNEPTSLQAESFSEKYTKLKAAAERRALKPTEGDIQATLDTFRNWKGAYAMGFRVSEQTHNSSFYEGLVATVPWAGMPILSSASGSSSTRLNVRRAIEVHASNTKQTATIVHETEDIVALPRKDRRLLDAKWSSFSRREPHISPDGVVWRQVHKAQGSGRTTSSKADIQEPLIHSASGRTRGHSSDQIFYQYQIAASKNVNEPGARKNMQMFLFMNYIPPAAGEIEALSTDLCVLGSMIPKKAIEAVRNEVKIGPEVESGWCLYMHWQKRCIFLERKRTHTSPSRIVLPKCSQNSLQW
ncbi:MAG: hypothetical protein J3Q66DRAFT_391826 [Benniella sp.]|nr:MAG: hypothetical protein J3Q66DRAFT_391826 [Benniella sp.]